MSPAKFERMCAALKFQNLPTYNEPDPHIRVYRVPAREIGFLSALLEAHDGIGQLRTLDEAKGIIECWVMPGSVDVFDAFIDSAAEEFPIQSIEKGFD